MHSRHTHSSARALTFCCLCISYPRWGLACALVVAVAGDLDFLGSSETRARLGWQGLEPGARASAKAVGLRRLAFAATAIALPLKVGLFYAAAQR